MATVGDLVQNIDTREDLLKIRNLGRRSADEIMDAIMEYQYTILPDGVAYGILHDMGMEGPIIRIVCIPEHGIKKPVGGNSYADPQRYLCPGRYGISYRSALSCVRS